MGGLFGDGLGYFCECFPVEKSDIAVLWRDFILGCEGGTGNLSMVGTGGKW